ncbi:MAG: tripartite tricarboxylate transporter TctB family protein [Burkholderiales bacterium]
MKFRLNSRRTLTAAAGVLFAAGSAFLLWQTRGLPSGLHGAPGPGVWPRIVFVVMLAVALYLAIDAARSDNEEPVCGPGTRLAVAFIILAILYLAGIESVGFFLITGLFLAASMWLLGLRSWKMLAGVAIGFPLIAYLVFVQVAHSDFPVGLLAPLFGS